MFIFTELSSQYNEEVLIRIFKTLPVGISYITGPAGRDLEIITPETGPIEVLESREDGKIFAIIDKFNTIREMHFGGRLVYVDLLNFNRTEPLHGAAIRYLGINFNERLPPRNRPNYRQ